MLSSRYLSLFFLVISLAFYQCKEDEDDQCSDPTNPKCANYDPCAANPEPRAAIITSEIGGLDQHVIPENDLLFGRATFFESPHSGDTAVKHTWYLGTEVIEENSFVRTFTNLHRPAEIPIRLKIEYPVDSTCYPNSLGYDSITVTRKFAKYYREFNTTGRFKVAVSGTTDSFTFDLTAAYVKMNVDTIFNDVEIYTDYNERPFQYSTKCLVYNFENIAEWRRIDPDFWTNTFMDLGYGFDNNGVNTILKEMQLEENGEIAINATNLFLNGDRTKTKYLGRKLN